MHRTGDKTGVDAADRQAAGLIETLHHEWPSRRTIEQRTAGSLGQQDRSVRLWIEAIQGRHGPPGTERARLFVPEQDLTPRHPADARLRVVRKQEEFRRIDAGREGAAIELHPETGDGIRIFRQGTTIPIPVLSELDPTDREARRKGCRHGRLHSKRRVHRDNALHVRIGRPIVKGQIPCDPQRANPRDEFV